MFSTTEAEKASIKRLYISFNFFYATAALIKEFTSSHVRSKRIVFAPTKVDPVFTK
jgi:hypothetical protein